MQGYPHCEDSFRGYSGGQDPGGLSLRFGGRLPTGRCASQTHERILCSPTRRSIISFSLYQFLFDSVGLLETYIMCT
jgi:hypothetical protein